MTNKATFLKTSPPPQATVLLVVPSGGCASVTSIFNANCVHRQSIVGITKKPDTGEPCHREL